MSTSSIQLPSDISANIASSAGSFLAGQGVAGYVILVAGVLLAAVVLDIIIGAIRGH